MLLLYLQGLKIPMNNRKNKDGREIKNYKEV